MGRSGAQALNQGSGWGFDRPAIGRPRPRANQRANKRGGGTMLAVGDKASLFVVPGTQGDVDLAAALAKGPLVLYFFPKAFTPG